MKNSIYPVIKCKNCGHVKPQFYSNSLCDICSEQLITFYDHQDAEIKSRKWFVEAIYENKKQTREIMFGLSEINNIKGHCASGFRHIFFRSYNISVFYLRIKKGQNNIHFFEKLNGELILNTSLGAAMWDYFFRCGCGAMFYEEIKRISGALQWSN